MLTKVEVRTALGMLLALEFDNIDDGYAVQEIDGLDPVKATLVSSSVANQDGAQFQSSHREPRDILLTLGLVPNPASTNVTELRKNLYTYFMPKSHVSLRFFRDDGPTVDISAVVESFESVLFTKDPVVTISLRCFQPDFVELDSITVEEETVEDMPEFVIDYEGTVEAGIIFVLNVDRPLTEFSIYSRPGDNLVRTLDFVADLEADDVLTINTNSGSKAVTLLRDSVQSSLLYGMSPQSDWIKLYNGENDIRVVAEGDPIPFTIQYTPRHGGL